MSKRIVTISREFGSGGHEIGKRVSELLGIPFYDKELIEKAVSKTGFSRDFIREAGEYAVATSSFLFHLAVSTASGNGTLSSYDQIYIAQNNIIKELANTERCVIVGRCADYILRERSDCLNVFIHADKESRIKRVSEQYRECEGKTVQEQLEEKDQTRKLYYKHYTGREWGAVQNYHIALESSTVGIERCAEWIAELAGQA